MQAKEGDRMKAKRHEKYATLFYHFAFTSREAGP